MARCAPPGCGPASGRALKEEQRSLDIRIGRKGARWQTNHGKEMKQFEQILFNLGKHTSTKERPFRRNHRRPSGRRLLQLFDDVLHKEQFGCVALHRKVLLDVPPLGAAQGWVDEDDITAIISNVLADRKYKATFSPPPLPHAAAAGHSGSQLGIARRSAVWTGR